MEKINDLNQYEFSAFSQNGEDGILTEIFKRIGTANKFFIEFGVENGLECNTTLLLLKGWRGLWIEANKHSFKSIKKRFATFIGNALTVKNAKVSAENINNLLSDVAADLDLLCIDIDGNDYHVWKAIQHKPRVVVIEYNALFPPDVACTVRYDAGFCWRRTCYFGASLKALEILGRQKGYSLVACDSKGINAFFIRSDLAGKFKPPYSAEHHYKPIAYRRHPRDFGAYELISEEVT